MSFPPATRLLRLVPEIWWVHLPAPVLLPCCRSQVGWWGVQTRSFSPPGLLLCLHLQQQRHGESGHAAGRQPPGCLISEASPGAQRWPRRPPLVAAWQTCLSKVGLGFFVSCPGLLDFGNFFSGHDCPYKRETRSLPVHQPGFPGQFVAIAGQEGRAGAGGLNSTCSFAVLQAAIFPCWGSEIL